MVCAVNLHYPWGIGSTPPADAQTCGLCETVWFTTLSFHMLHITLILLILTQCQYCVNGYLGNNTEKKESLGVQY